MESKGAKDFLVKKGVDCIHIGNIDKFSELLEEYHAMKVKEYLMKRNKRKHNK
jgi:hypothetical protein